MPKTIIQINTMFCPTGLGNPNASCRFHRASDNMTPDGKCPTCKLDLVKSIDPLDKITMTVMGEEDIEEEILERDEPTHRLRRNNEIENNIINQKKNGELENPVKEAKHRKEALEQVERNIANLKVQDFFFTTSIQQNVYREKRKGDIRKAIVSAKLLEDK